MTDPLDRQSSPGAGQPRAGPARSRATVRASLACVHCRSKHVKCDGGLPSCSRCRTEDKSCHYAKSRRGIRDAKKRSMMRDEASSAEQDDFTDNTPSPNFGSLSIPIHYNTSLPGGWTLGAETTPNRSMKSLYELYYLYFHDSHSWLPPKGVLSLLIESQEDEFEFMVSMILYVGSMYSAHVDTGPLRDRVFELASGPLPMTVWNVQALLCTSIAVLGESRSDLAGTWFNKSMEMSLAIGLHDKSFADAEPHPVLAESYRRTYWALYTHGSLRTVREHLGHFQLYSIPATTDLPCEEWEYQSAEIPPPKALHEYHQGGHGKAFSSWAYFVDLTRICGEYVVPLLNMGREADADAIDRADSRIASWLNQLPKWKTEVIDPDGTVDMILYHALGVAHGLRVRIQLHLCGIGVNFGACNLASQGPLMGPPAPAPANMAGRPNAWSLGSTAIQASMGLVALFKSSLPPEKLSPSCILGIERALLPFLDGQLLGGPAIPVLGERALLLVSVLRKAGEFWPTARSVYADVLGAFEMAAARTQQPGEGVGTWDSLAQELGALEMGAGDADSFATQMTVSEMGAWADQIF